MFYMEPKNSYMNIRIEQSEHDWLKAYAALTERSVASVARLAIRDFINNADAKPNNALTPEQREALARLDAAETLPALKPDGWPCT